MSISKIILATCLLFLLSCEETKYAQGKKLYTIACESCHMEDGQGLQGIIPPLAQADYLREHQEDLVSIITKGIADTIMVNGILYAQPMEGISTLTPVQTTNIINYINTAWGNDYPIVSLAWVEEKMREEEQ